MHKSYNFSISKPEDINQIEELFSISGVDERLDYNCDFLLARNGDDRILGFAGINLHKRYPQFEHIIITPKYQKTRLLIKIMMCMERYLKEKGYKEYVAYILNTNNPMQIYALKFGFKAYDKDDKGVWLYKKI